MYNLLLVNCSFLLSRQLLSNNFCLSSSVKLGPVVDCCSHLCSKSQPTHSSRYYMDDCKKQTRLISLTLLQIFLICSSQTNSLLLPTESSFGTKKPEKIRRKDNVKMYSCVKHRVHRRGWGVRLQSRKAKVRGLPVTSKNKFTHYFA